MKTVRSHIMAFAALVLLALCPACDNSVNSDDGTGNRPPDADDIEALTVMNNPVVVTCTASDEDGDTLVFSIVDRPSNGSLVRTGAATWRYEPDEDYIGNDAFTYRVNDGITDSDTAVVSIVVDADPDLPMADPIPVTVVTGQSVEITLTGSTANEWDTLTYVISSNPRHGALSSTAEDYIYVYEPDAGFTGFDSFTYCAIVVEDPTRISAPATVSITVAESGNVPPEAEAQSYNTDEDTACPMTLAGTDTDGPDELTYEIVTPPSLGTLSPVSNSVDPELTYTSGENINGEDTFTYRVFDGVSYSDPVQVTITIHPVNDAPTAKELYVNTTVNTELKIELRGEDIDGDTLVYEIIDTPSIDERIDVFEPVTLSVNEWRFIVQTVNTYYFTYRVVEQYTDTALSSEAVQVTIEVTQPGTLYVKPDGTEDGDGRSWHSAYSHPALAVEKAAEMASILGPDDDNIEVWIAGDDDEPYFPLEGDNFVFVIPERVTIIGGFAGYERTKDQRPYADLEQTILANNTTLDGNGQANHVIIGADNAIIDGFTITGGAAVGEGTNSIGGGIYNDNCSMQILNCAFTDNKASYGGAIYNGEGSGTSTAGGIVIDGCAFTGNSASLDGGAVFNADNTAVSVTSCSFDANGADYTGGALCSLSAVTVVGSDFSGNTAEAGGAVYDYNGASAFTGCGFAGNSAESGGAVYNTGAITITADTANEVPCTFSDNRADYGGAVYNDSSGITGGIYIEAVFNDVVFISNSASASGGAVYNKRCTPIFTACTFLSSTGDEDPAAVTAGGAVYGEWCYTSFDDCSFTYSTAGTGGAVYADRGSLECDGCAFSHCGSLLSGMQSDYGGAAYVTGGIAAVFADSSFSYGRAQFGAGAYFDEDTSADISGCAFTGNTASKNGGGAYFSAGSSADFTDCRLSGNTATGNGGGAYLAGYGEYSFINCLVTDNTGYYGAGIYESGATLTILHATMANNDSTGYTNGGIHFSGGSATITNSVLWGIYYNDTVGFEPVVTGTASPLNITYCDISQEEYQENTGCIDQQPRFMGGSHPYMMEYEYTVTDSNGDETTETSENLDAGTDDLDQEVLEIINGGRSLNTQYDYFFDPPVGMHISAPDIGYHY